LDTLLNQTYQNIEVLCINDGSTDHSLNVLNECAAKDNRVRVFSKRNEGKGAASARNMGLDNAVGKYVQFLDSDDFFELDMVESIVNKAKQSDADVVVYGAQWYDDKLQKITGNYNPIRLDLAPAKDVFSYKNCPKHIFQIGDIIAWNKLYKRDLLTKRNLRFEPINISDDQYVPCLAMVFAERIATVDKKFVNYRTNTGTGQTDSRTKHPSSAYLPMKSIVARMQGASLYEEVKQSYLNIILPVMRWYYDVMATFDAFKFLHDKLKDDIFVEMGLAKLPQDYFYDDKLYQWIRMIFDNSAAEVAFQAAYKLSRTYGTMAATTAILRF
jgi:glycosyltransferase involved in cell wall biosynthesis